MDFSPTCPWFSTIFHGRPPCSIESGRGNAWRKERQLWTHAGLCEGHRSPHVFSVETVFNSMHGWYTRGILLIWKTILNMLHTCVYIYILQFYDVLCKYDTCIISTYYRYIIDIRTHRHVSSGTWQILHYLIPIQFLLAKLKPNSFCVRTTCPICHLVVPETPFIWFEPPFFVG